MKLLVTLLCLALLCLTLGQAALAKDIISERKIPLEPGNWAREDRMQFGSYLGTPAAMLTGGPFAANGTDITDGRIDVDIAMHGQRGFVGVTFRDAGDGNFELVYLRPHKTRLPDALQYTPAINGLTGWQLYSNEGFTAAAELPHNRWVHVALEFVGDEARVYIDNASEPALVIPDLKGTTNRGAVGIWGRNVAHFANFKVTEYKPGQRSEPRFEAGQGVIDDWEISPVFEAATLPPAEIPSGITWTPATLEAPGMLNLSRYHAKLARNDRTNPDSNLDVIFARTTIRVDEAQRRKIWLGYSDEVTLYLNGKPVWEGRQAFAHRYPFSLGIVGLEQDAVWLDLEPGDNELTLAVGEIFGGWGFMAKFADPTE